MFSSFLDEVNDASAEFITIDGLVAELIDRINTFGVDENIKVEFEEFLYSIKDNYDDDEMEDFLDSIYSWCLDE